MLNKYWLKKWMNERMDGWNKKVSYEIGRVTRTKHKKVIFEK